MIRNHWPFSLLANLLITGRQSRSRRVFTQKERSAGLGKALPELHTAQLDPKLKPRVTWVRAHDPDNLSLFLVRERVAVVFDQSWHDLNSAGKVVNQGVIIWKDNPGCSA